jgi:hypothetical protein
MFYILNESGVVVRTATRVPNPTGLQAAGYTVVESELNIDIGSVDVRGFPAKPVIAEKTVEALPRIVMTASAAEIPADGKSKLTLKVSLEDVSGKPLRKSIEVGFKVTAGAISRRSVKTEGGKATVYLTAGHETVAAIAGAFAEGYTPAVVTVEFVPVK